VSQESLDRMPRLIQGVKNMLPDVVAVSAKGAWVNTACGRKFLDFASGIGVCNLGHSHEGVTKAVQKAAGTLVHAQMNIMRHKPMIDLIDKLASLPLSKKASLDSWFLWNSGSEAVEGAVKLAKQATGKPNIIAMQLGYHGRTFMAMGLTTSGTIYRAGFGPLPSGVFVAPFPYVSRGPYAQEALAAPSHIEQQCGCSTGCSCKCAYYGRAPLDVANRDVVRCLEGIELMLRTQTAPSETAAILVEPILGEGGYVPPPPGFLAGLRAICDKHGMLLIADEVQTGFGRTGSWFASDWLDGGVNPDIIVSAKGLANGFPLSAVGTRSELSAKQPGGSMGGTYGGNAVSCAASLAVFEAFEADDGAIFRNIKAREKQCRQLLADFNKKHPGIIREGSFGALAPRVAAEAHKRDLLLLSCGPYDTLRLIPPLNVTEQETSNALNILSEAMLAATR
jgi:4-aminobutyrate aminotransferase